MFFTKRSKLNTPKDQTVNHLELIPETPRKNLLHFPELLESPPSPIKRNTKNSNDLSFKRYKPETAFEKKKRPKVDQAG